MDPVQKLGRILVYLDEFIQARKHLFVVLENTTKESFSQEAKDRPLFLKVSLDLSDWACLGGCFELSRQAADELPAELAVNLVQLLD